MLRNRLRAFLMLPALLLIPGAGVAGKAEASDKPDLNIVATIRPVHSLLSLVAGDRLEPALLMDRGGSAHHFSLRPSQAALLQDADLVVRIGPGLEGGLDHALESIARDGHVMQLDGIEGLTRLPLRRNAFFAAHDHDHGDHDHDEHEEHGHDDHEDDDHKDHDHDDHHDEHHEEHDDHHEDHADMDALPVDPHLWLDPDNAIAMMSAMAAKLGELDPAGAALYRANADQAGRALQDQASKLAGSLASVRTKPFILFHDSTQYFEQHFGLKAAAALALTPEQRPGAKRIQEIRDIIKQTGTRCLFLEPGMSPDDVAPLVEGIYTDATTGSSSGGITLQPLDPAGSSLEPGPGLYSAILQDFAESFGKCLNQ